MRDLEAAMREWTSQLVMSVMYVLYMDIDIQ